MKILGTVTKVAYSFNKTGSFVQAFFIDDFRTSCFVFSNKHGVYWYN